MKKHITILAALLLGGAAAQAQVYVNGAIGTSHANLDCAGTTSCKNNGTATKLFAGYGFGNGFSVELGYLSFGKYSATFDGINGRIKPSGVALGGLLALPLGTDWGMNFRLGAVNMRTTVEATSGSFNTSQSETKTQAYAGLGLTYALSKAAKVEFALDSSQASMTGEKATIRMFTVGVSYAF
jgi:OmpA-OmpF porin, OOP family